MSVKYPTLEQVENANADSVMHWYGTLHNPRTKRQKEIMTRVIERFIDLWLIGEIKKYKKENNYESDI